MSLSSWKLALFQIGNAPVKGFPYHTLLEQRGRQEVRTEATMHHLVRKGKKPPRMDWKARSFRGFVLPCIGCGPGAISKLKITGNRISTPKFVQGITSLGRSVKPRPFFSFFFFFLNNMIESLLPPTTAPWI